MATHDHAAQHDDAAVEKELNRLRQEYERLREDRVRTEQDLANLGSQLDDLKREAEEAYGTSDPKELERILSEQRAENERLVAEYREHIVSIRTALDKVEADSSAMAGGNGDDG